MPVIPPPPTALSGAVFRGTTAVRQGLLTDSQLQGRLWRHIRQDVYADASLPLDHSLACRAILLRLPSGTTLAGPSAAYLHGVSHAAAFGDEIHIITPPGVRLGAQQNLRVHHLSLSAGEIDPDPTCPAQPRPEQPGTSHPGSTHRPRCRSSTLSWPATW